MILLALVALPLLGALVGAQFRSICGRCWATGILLAEVTLVVAALGGAAGPAASYLGLDPALHPVGGLIILVATAATLVGLFATDEASADPVAAASALAGLAGVALAATSSDALLGAGLGVGLSGFGLVGAMGWGSRVRGQGSGWEDGRGAAPRTEGRPGIPARAVARAARRALVWLTLAAGVLVFADALDRLSAQPTSAVLNRLDLAGPTAALFVVGIGIGASALPFWSWLPSLGERAPAGAALGAGLVGCAALAGLTSVLASTSWLVDQTGAGPILTVVGGLAALACAFLALGAKQPARVVAFLVGANADLALAGLAASPAGDVAGAVWLLAAQALAGTLAFSALAGARENPATTSGRRPALDIGLAVAALSLVGMPPTAGFVGRLLLAQSAASSWFAADVALTGAIGGLAALRAFLPRDAPGGAPFQPPRALDLAALALAVALIAGGLLPGPVLNLVR